MGFGGVDEGNDDQTVEGKNDGISGKSALYNRQSTFAAQEVLAFDSFVRWLWMSGGSRSFDSLGGGVGGASLLAKGGQPSLLYPNGP